MTRYVAVRIVLAFVAIASHAPTARPAETNDRSGVTLGKVRISHTVQADGKPVAPGVYELRLTEANALPTPAGETAGYEQWVEFVQQGDVKGREVASIVPAREIGQVADGPTPQPGQHRVEVLKGNTYLRIWLLRDGRHFLIHLPILR